MRWQPPIALERGNVGSKPMRTARCSAWVYTSGVRFIALPQPRSGRSRIAVMVIGGSVRPAKQDRQVGRVLLECVLACSAGPNSPARAAIGITYANTSPNTMIPANCHPRRMREPRTRLVNRIAEARRQTSACDRKFRPRLASPSNASTTG